MPKLIQISDTHLSPVQGFFYENFRVVTDAINAAKPDAVVTSGDLSINGPKNEDDLAFARWCHDQIEAPVYFLPGNHDIGEEPGSAKVTKKISEVRLERYYKHFDSCRFSLTLGDWKLIGLNSQLFNTGFSHEEDQWGWLETALQHDGPVGVFQHKPMFAMAPDEPPRPRLTVSPAILDKLHDIYKAANVRFIGSGHIHLHRHKVFEGIAHVWCPSTAFHPSNLPPQFDGSLGYMEYVFDAHDFTATLVSPDGMNTRSLADVKENGRYEFLKDVPVEPVEVAWR
ncbi:MAG: metallophosphoesterase [Proteobacteria bacterium]|nr:metallophosphoesterase [Pseudomonadota bacterium]